MSSNKKDILDLELQDSTNSFDLIDYNNIYDDLNLYYVNSYDDKDEIIEKKPIGSLTIISNDDKIEFIHTDDVSERHKKIHEDKKSNTTKKTPSKSITSKKSASKKTSTKKTTTTSYSSSSSTYSSPTYSESQYKSKPEVESYSTKEKKKKNSSGCLWIFIVLFFIAPNLFTSCDDLSSLLGDTLSSEISNILDGPSYEEEEEVFFDGEKSELKEVYETSDSEKRYPYYYDTQGNVYDWDLKLIDYWSVCEFPKETMAEIKVLSLTTKHKDKEGFITAFVDPVTNEGYYVIDGSFYNEYDSLTAIGDITVPTNVLIEITNYTNKKIQGN